MGLRKWILLFFLCAFASPVLAQEDSISPQNEYIKTFTNVITVRPFLLNTSNSLTVKDRTSNDELELTANKQDRLGASIAFRSLVLSYSFAPNFIAINTDNKDSRIFNLNLRTFFGQWMQTITLFDEKGFFLENDMQSVYLPKTSSFKIGGGTSYILNPNFSFKAITSQNEKQTKSTGSFIPRIVYFYSVFDLKDDIGNRAKLKTFDLAFAPSYYYNWVPVKNLLTSAGMSAGLGLNISESEDNSLTSLLTELNFRGSIIYDKNNLYIGGSYSYLILNHNSDRSTYIKDNIPTLELFIGYRFNAPKSFIKLADAINKSIGI
jgi:hypothetical protein